MAGCVDKTIDLKATEFPTLVKRHVKVEPSPEARWIQPE